MTHPTPAPLGLTIRPAHPDDREAFIRLSQVSIAEENIANGLTPDALARQFRTLLRGRGIPLRILMKLMGFSIEAFVAVVDGKVVGVGIYSGQPPRAILSYLMVDPAYRRQGIGQALLKARLERIATHGYAFVTTTILANNPASLGNVGKQGFAPYGRDLVFERPLPTESLPAAELVCRPLVAADQEVFRAVEEQAIPPFVRYAHGSAEGSYFQSLWDRLYDRFSSASTWVRAFERQGEVIGFLYASTTKWHTKGVIARPMVADEHIELLPAILDHALAWLRHQGKSDAQFTVPESRQAIVVQLEGAGWSRIWTWVNLVKWLDEAARREHMPEEIAG